MSPYNLEYYKQIIKACQSNLAYFESSLHEDSFVDIKISALSKDEGDLYVKRVSDIKDFYFKMKVHYKTWNFSYAESE